VSAFLILRLRDGAEISLLTDTPDRRNVKATSFEAGSIEEFAQRLASTRGNGRKAAQGNQ
jgi:hypothetical protein